MQDSPAEKNVVSALDSHAVNMMFDGQIINTLDE